MSDESRKRFKFDIAVIGASAIDDQGTVLEFDPMEVDLVRDVLPQSRRVILAAHQEKFGRSAPHIVTTLNEVDVLISNAVPHLRDRLGNDLLLPPNLRVINA
jgi:DeoR family glycerol-3-phosphate regulon repressor